MGFHKPKNKAFFLGEASHEMIYGVLAPSQVHQTPVNSGDKLWENLKLVDWKASKEVMVQEGKNLFRDMEKLVVEPTPLKNMSQIGNLPQIGVKITIFETTT